MCPRTSGSKLSDTGVLVRWWDLLPASDSGPFCLSQWPPICTLRLVSIGSDSSNSVWAFSYLGVVPGQLKSLWQDLRPVESIFNSSSSPKMVPGPVSHRTWQNGISLHYWPICQRNYCSPSPTSGSEAHESYDLVLRVGLPSLHLVYLLESFISPPMAKEQHERVSSFSLH